MAELTEVPLDGNNQPAASGSNTAPTLAPVRDAIGPISAAIADAGGEGSLSAKMRRMTSQLEALKTALEIMDDWDESDRAKVNLIVGQAGITAGAGNVAANTPRMTFAADDPVKVILGAAADAAAADGTIKAALRAIATALGVTALDLGSGTGGSRTLRVMIDTAQLPAGVAHDGADSGNPLKIGGRARSSEITPVANNDRADLITDLAGKLINLPYANPENFVSGAITSAMTGTTSTQLIAAPGAGLRNYITSIVVSNAHASVGTDVVIQDGSGGTVLMTIPAAALYGGAVIELPVPLRQPTANTALYCANVTTGASTKVSAVGYKGA